MAKRHRSHYETSGGKVTDETCYLRIMDDYDDIMDHLAMLAHLRADADPLMSKGFLGLVEMHKLIKERFRIMATGKLNKEALESLTKRILQ